MKAIKIILISSIIIFIAYGGIRWTVNFMKIDTCLDKGGRWNYSSKKCECADSTINDNREQALRPKLNGSMLIEERCAVLFNPDTLKISKAKKVRFHWSEDLESIG